MNEGTERNPLSWPPGWPRTRSPRRSAFGEHAFGHVRDELYHELRLLGATSVLLSSDVPLRLDGIPYASAGEPKDHGAAVYFRIKGEPRVLACDKWDRIADNLHALALHVSSIRGQLRWGVGTLEQAFGGYRALQAMEPPKQWWEVLGVAASTPTVDVEAARLRKLERCHPDKGGRTSDAININVAYDEFRRERGLVA